ncbi:proton-coupled zinc antiporter SLC30A1-like [Ornithodoros turicata]|uniref:proton-coupled zinc antiporter SLC30A1-like n=1 Tax=Ornithodoros turicata TaxID=34597 RepID=UPI003138E8D9
MEPSCVKLYLAMAMAAFFFLSELVASHVTHSLVLLTCAYQMLYNVLAIVLLVLSYHVCRERTLRNTFGWARLEVLGALVNLLFQMALCFAISVAAIQTLVHASHESTEPRLPLLLLCFGILGLAVHTVCYLVIHTRHKNRRGCNVGIVSGTDVQVNFVLGDDTAEEACQLSPEQIPIPPAVGGRTTVHWQECASEALRTCGGCLLLMACAVAVHFGDGPLPRYVDPALAIVAVLVLVCTSYPRMKESGLILLQNMPKNVDMETLQKKLLQEFPAIINVHEFHLWQLTNSQLIATVHIAVDSEAAYASLAGKVSRFLKDQGIALPTVQPEFCQGDHSASPCILRCSKGKACGTLTCCREDHDEAHGTARRRNASHDRKEQAQQQLQAPLLQENRTSSFLHLDEGALGRVNSLQETDV